MKEVMVRTIKLAAVVMGVVAITALAVQALVRNSGSEVVPEEPAGPEISRAPLAPETAINHAEEEDQDRINLNVRLVWGTDDEATVHPKLAAVDTEATQKLQSIFKWKTYLEILERDIETQPGQEIEAQISPKCLLRISNLGDSRIRVKLVGEGRSVGHQTQRVPMGHILTFAGEDKGDSAWFIVMKRVPLSPSSNW